jgi:phytoene dehydrogenase-like protein
MSAPHLFYRKTVKVEQAVDLEDFENREIEICLWSEKAPDLVPKDRAALVLRVGFPYDSFGDWRTGERKRRDGYGAYKVNLAQKLIAAVENILPGLANSVELIEVATPLTYRDWGNRYSGSIAGWTWSSEEAKQLPAKLMIETPIQGLLMAGIYAASELFLGGVPTAMHTGSLAADIILGKM